MTTPLQQLLKHFNECTLSERDKGTLFEKLMIQYFKNEPMYQEMYSDILTYAEWVAKYQFEETKKDAGIDLVAVPSVQGEEPTFHAIQCKNYSSDHTIRKADLDSFFTASGKSYFSHRYVVLTTDKISENVENAIKNQQIPVSTISLYDLENSKIDWTQYHEEQPVVLKSGKQLRDHQTDALKAITRALDDADRGKMIMACGTGKTFTSLRIAEEIAGKGKRVLFLVPSLNLLGQTLREWTQDTVLHLNNFAVCSDSEVGKKGKKDDDTVITSASDLQFPATTNAKSLARAIEMAESTVDSTEKMTVVYSTYHSIEVLSIAQKEHGLPEFDLIICDEAHRTTGAKFDGEEESAFVRVHDNDFIKGKKRLYMTATPRIYGEVAKQTEGVTLCSMDDEALYGKNCYVLTFSEAVSRDLLVDYKVLVLAVEEQIINRRLQSLLSDSDNALKVDDAAKIIGCWKALAKYGVSDSLKDDAEPMQRAVAFCQVIEKEHRGNKHKVSSKLISEMFGEVVEAYQQAEITQLEKENDNPVIDPSLKMKCEVQHVDGSMNAVEKEKKLEWLKTPSPDNTCRILSNVRCLSEGVDVPALDAVLFLTPRNSQVDVVQSIGRVMRLSPGKKQGYVILPVVIPAGMEPSKALDNNESYRVVWQVLNALRAHDDRFDAMINKLEFNGKDISKMEVIAVASEVHRKAPKQSKARKAARGGTSIGSKISDENGTQTELLFEIGEVERALYAKIVKKCGNRHHWEDWSNDIAKIAQTHIDRIKAILENKNHTEEIAAFNEFAKELRDDLNNSISDEEIIEMLAQHLITKPVFDALFEDYSFTQHNPMSQSMQNVLDKLHEHSLDKEADTLQSFYDSVKMRASGIQSAEGKQKIVVELYDKFFRNAFPKMTERLGIVYTPVEVVDFIIRSVEDLLNQEFNVSMADKGVHILDPFTGTGTFITRLLQSGIIPADKLPDKYKNEIHANEIVLLAYYIAAINIEATYHSILAGSLADNEVKKEVDFLPFDGICLTDTFQMYETEDLASQIFVENSSRRKRQKGLDIRVIVGNPPYSAGQESANDNNANVAYPGLDARIRSTYANYSTGVNKNSLYDSYIRSIRWASDRIGNQGILGFVTNAGFVDGNAMDGLRKCLAEEFSSLYIFHLRGNQRTAGERSRKEGGKIFGSGSRAPIAISLLVKNPQAKEQGKIYLHDIGDYLTREEKLDIIQELGSVKTITEQNSWQEIIPDRFNDWINQRDPNFDKYLPLGAKKEKGTLPIFENYSRGVATSRDFWVYNYSAQILSHNINKSINFYNSEVDRYISANSKGVKAENFVSFDSTYFSWDRANKWDLEKCKKYSYNQKSLYKSLYRPFTKTNLYFNRQLNNMVYQIPQIFPTAEAENLAICLTVTGTKGFSVLISNLIPDLHLIGDSQCFPLYLYEKSLSDSSRENSGSLFGESKVSEENYTRKDAITDEAMAYFQEAYPNQTFSKEDVFYYVYGLLHSEEYRERYADNLSKQLPRMPRVKRFEDFMAFSQAGRDLAALHLNYETLKPYPVTFSGSLKYNGNDFIDSTPEDFRVTKMKFGKSGKETDKTTVLYNNKITMGNIPEEAYDYIVNGKPALEWVMERQAVTTHKESGITNDANDWAIETMNDPRYPLELFQRVITVSLETQKIVNNLPKLDI